MSAILSDYIPSISYIGSVDITSGTNGNCMFYVSYDASLSSVGNLLMFEYKIIEQGDSVIPDNISTGFVAIENATNTGISNQWQIAVAALNNQYNPSTPNKIAIRVYVGVSDSSEVGVTPWSNELNVHNPPSQPIIYSAYYDANSISTSSDDLYIFLNIDPDIDYSTVKFIAAFYYTDMSGNTVWDVSEPTLSSTEIIGEVTKQMVHVSDFGLVSNTTQVVYTSVYAVYQFIDSSSNFYSVSQVSVTEEALPASDYGAPLITSIDYSVYTSGVQNMIVNWDAPGNSGIPTYTVDHYILKKSTDGTTWTDVATDIASSTLQYTVDVSQYSCDTMVYFQVTAVSTNGTLSPASDTNDDSHLEIFKYALAPTDLVITNTTYSGGVVGMTVNFTTPSSNGCGTPTQFAIVVDGSVNYQSYTGAGTYSVALTDLEVDQSGTVEVYLITTDTNPSTQGGSSYLSRNGASITTPYIATNLTLDSVVYQVYTNGTQNMDLDWNSPVQTDWTVTSYKVYYNAGSGNTLEATQSTTGYIFDTSSYSCGTTLTFYIEAILTNDDVNYTVTSNSVSENIFKYATVPQNCSVNWAVGNSNSTLMDIRTTFENPSSVGCGTVVTFVVNVKDSDGDIISTQDVVYNASSSSYQVNFNDIAYSSTGNVEFYMVNTDTNSSNDLDGATQTVSYTTDVLPIFANVSMNGGRTQLTFDTITNSLLAPGAQVIYTDNTTGAISSMPWSTIGDTTGVVVTLTTLTNDEYNYHVVMTSTTFMSLSTFPVKFVLAVSNTAGIGTRVVV